MCAFLKLILFSKGEIQLLWAPFWALAKGLESADAKCPSGVGAVASTLLLGLHTAQMVTGHTHFRVLVQGEHVSRLAELFGARALHSSTIKSHCSPDRSEHLQPVNPGDATAETAAALATACPVCEAPFPVFIRPFENSTPGMRHEKTKPENTRWKTQQPWLSFVRWWPQGRLSCVCPSADEEKELRNAGGIRLVTWASRWPDPMGSLMAAGHTAGGSPSQ